MEICDAAVGSPALKGTSIGCRHALPMREFTRRTARRIAGLVLGVSLAASLGAVAAAGTVMEAVVGAPLFVAPWSVVLVVTAAAFTSSRIARRSRP